MWLSLEPGKAICDCGGTWEVERSSGAFPDHGRGQCYAGHCEAWPEDMMVVIEDDRKKGRRF